MHKKNSKKNLKTSSKKKNNSSFFSSFVKLLFLLALLGASSSSIIITWAFWHYSNDPDLPKVEKLRTFTPKQCTTIKDKNHITLAKIGEYKRTYLKYNQFPKVLINAVLAAEDVNFFKHKGINLLGMLRAFIVNLKAGKMRQGGSTITQQVVKNLLLTPRRTLKRKIQEVILSRRLENELSKEKILELYLNQVYLGHGRYGMEEGALFYFGKHVKDLTIPEAALLAGLVQGPELLSPFKHPEKSKIRRSYVLNQMYKHGFISKQELKSSLKTPLPTTPKSKLHPNEASEVIELIKRTIPIHKLEGKTIISTIDLNIQKKARQFLQKGLQRIDKRLHVTILPYIKKPKKLHGGIILARVCCKRGNDIIVSLPDGTKGIVKTGWDRYYPNGFIWLDNIPKSRRKRRRLRRKHKKPIIGPSLGLRVRELGVRTPYQDVSKTLALELGPQGAIVLLGLPDAKILAIIGGYNGTPGMFDRATQSLRQPGSTFKSFVYALALESKKFTPASTLQDAPTVHGKWVPRSHSKYMGNVRLRVALAKSLNSIAVQLAQTISPKSIVELAKNAGITTKLSKDLSIALGSSGVYPIEMAGAYTMFPLLGIVKKPTIVQSLGNSIKQPELGKKILSRQTAWLMISMLRSVVLEGTARRAKRLPFKIAGKTGTTNRSKDAWFIGFNKHFLCAVWVGYDDSKPMGRRISGSSAALPIFMDVMKYVMKGKKDEWFPMISGIVTQLIDPKTGQAVHPGTPNAIEEYFIEGTAPQPPPLELPTESSTSQQDAGDLLVE